MSRVHELKCWPGPFNALVAGRKRHEYRIDDRGYEVGDYLALLYFDPSPNMGFVVKRWTLVRITYIGRGFGIPEGYVCMSIKRENTPAEVTPVPYVVRSTNDCIGDDYSNFEEVP